MKENIELFFKKDSNFKRPLKTDVIYAKLTKGFVPHYEWNGHRRRIPWKVLKKDQTVNKFPSGLFTFFNFVYIFQSADVCLLFSAFFTTKTGLHQSLQQLHWYSPFPVSSFFPRCYQVSIFSISIKSMYACTTYMNSAVHAKLPGMQLLYSRVIAGTFRERIMGGGGKM